jgi:hypothetical protein
MSHPSLWPHSGNVTIGTWVPALSAPLLPRIYQSPGYGVSAIQLLLVTDALEK